MSDDPGVPDRPDTPGTSAQPGAGGLPGFGGLLESAQQAFSAQAEAAQQVAEGSAGGGVVTVTMTGAGEVTAVTIAPEVVDPDDIEMLQDLVVAALHDAGKKVTELQRNALGALGGLDLGGLGDMLGGLTPGGGPGTGPGAGPALPGAGPGGGGPGDDPPGGGGPGSD